MSEAARVSTIPAVKAALLEKLKHASWPHQSPDISYGVPRDPWPRELVMLTSTRETSQTWGPTSTQIKRRDESYTLLVFVYASTPGSTQQEATERAYEMAGVIEDLLRPNGQTLGVRGVLWAEVTAGDLTEAPMTNGYESVVEIEIRVRARL
jgi:hypothetical protein